MKILIEYNPNIIRLKGDKEQEAFANYMYNRYGIKVIDSTFACNFFVKYHCEAKLFEYKNIKFFYSLFLKK